MNYLFSMIVVTLRNFVRMDNILVQNKDFIIYYSDNNERVEISLSTFEDEEYIKIEVEIKDIILSLKIETVEDLNKLERFKQAIETLRK